MKISYNKLIAEAETTGFRPEILEKVFQLFGLLDTLWKHPFGFLVYGAMSRKDWRTTSIDDIKFDVSDLENQLLPTLHTQTIGSREEIIKYSNKLEIECRKLLTKVLPFEDNEFAFLDLLLDHGEIDPSLITSDPVLHKKIQDQPMLKWKAQNVRQYKKLSKN